MLQVNPLLRDAGDGNSASPIGSPFRRVVKCSPRALPCSASPRPSLKASCGPPLDLCGSKVPFKWHLFHWACFALFICLEFSPSFKKRCCPLALRLEIMAKHHVHRVAAGACSCFGHAARNVMSYTAVSGAAVRVLLELYCPNAAVSAPVLDVRREMRCLNKHCRSSSAGLLWGRRVPVLLEVYCLNTAVR